MKNTEFELKECEIILSGRRQQNIRRDYQKQYSREARITKNHSKVRAKDQRWRNPKKYGSTRSSTEKLIYEDERRVSVWCGGECDGTSTLMMVVIKKHDMAATSVIENPFLVILIVIDSHDECSKRPPTLKMLFSSKNAVSLLRT
ncbi:hypothetical protein PV325_001457 [Microctonus aethiopoides]|uniref:Uncharacterized protein n=1 Tax=Microctonus aethiopoides TaxID=144406 RepID=A0AA39EZ13_9HYME|nr:hypothetical protein PV325_001457 [Microctonus aethiopoides]KAK0086935.1 hypothetical protein PV326_005391 [Microctonus aethiopoides]KAK0160307.1 hypothetical protein PV328_007735 [Microctonus aethiopoides]